MKAKETKTEWVRKLYWEEFHKTYPDPSEFRSFVASEPTLIKIFNFCSVPSIWDGVRKFPFDDKIKELESIGEDEKDYLQEAYWTEKDKQKQNWLEYLDNMFGMVRSTVMLKKELDSVNEKLQSKYNNDQTLEIVENFFRYCISVNETITLSSTPGRVERTWKRGMGYSIIRVVHRKGPDIQANIHHFFFKPDDIETSFEWDVYWVQAFKKYQYDDLFDSPAKTFTIQHYYEGKPLLRKPFKVPIAQRYGPLLWNSAKKMKKILQDDFEMALQEAKIALSEAIKKYDSTKGPVANYFELFLKQYYPGNLFDKLSTTDGAVACNDSCKHEMRYKGELPCCFETEAGFCSKPENKRRLISKVDHSGGSLDDFINSDNEDAGRRIDLLKDENTPESEMISRENLEPIRNDKKFMDIVGSKKSKPAKDRKYVERKRKEIKKSSED